jgi:outer membrane lipase/esterase
MNRTLFQRLIRATSLVACTLVGVPAMAVSFSDVVIFGDSLSDTGNVLALTTAFAPPPFPNFLAAPGRFSNGPVWDEYLASSLGHPAGAAPSHLIFNGSAVVPIGPVGGHNFSFGGARTGLGGSAGATTGLLGQLVAWNGAAFSTSLTRPADPNALYVVVAGGNDLRDFRSGVAGALNPLQTATNVVNVLGLLAQAGAEHFLISTLPDLGKSPEAVALGLVPQSTAATLAFNAALSAGSGLLDAQFLAATGIDLDIRTLDMYGLGQALYDDAVNHGGAQYGIVNVTTPCIAPVAPGAYFFPGSTDINCAISEFSDPLHPSGVAHRLIGQAASVAVGVVPEPETYALLAVGLVAVMLRRRASQVR